jgi:hypothetical protein
MRPSISAYSLARAASGHGDPDHGDEGGPDAVLLGGKAAVRAERLGHGNGRVYHLGFTARDAAGATCTGTVTTCVPHDNGKRARCGDEGPLYDSLKPARGGEREDRKSPRD